MGGCWSCDEDDRRESAYAPRVNPPRPRQPAIRRPEPTVSSFRSNYVPYSYPDKAVTRIPNEPIRNQISQPRTVVVPPAQVVLPTSQPLYGEFKCGCGYFWVSRLSWYGRYQQCKRCKAHVRPKNQRVLLPTDYSRDKDDVGDHLKELCQMCKQLGRHCGKK